MSVSDPLIKDIKGHLLALFNESMGTKITDSSTNLHGFCQDLEKIFHCGLVQSQGAFYGSRKSDAFTWMGTIPGDGTTLLEFKYKSSVEEVQGCKCVSTSLGKFRLLVRLCLVKNCIHFPLQFLINSNRAHSIYDKNSIIGDEILAAILLSVLLQCSKITFQLQIFNSYFLDSTWQIPDLLKLEVVPCSSLGISISFSENKAVIVHIAGNSVASETAEISTGDVLANLNGVDINSSCKGRLNAILRLNKGRPVTLAIIKAFHKDSNDVFLPMKSILRHLQIDLMKITSGQTSATTAETSGVSIIQSAKTGYRGTYLGCVGVGSKGSVKQIEEAIRRRLGRGGEKKEVVFEIGEMSIKIVDAESNKPLLKHSYMQISSCGSAVNLPNYVAYIAGEENCDTASNFVCYIFHVKDIEEAAVILQSIGQGFYRTHFAV
ncbi:uncharacterized protein LOC135133353 isoform X1 [Zophobas morio]|uniref:uncharacterized protein LOC135133353 isoform X1 n=1 Tax=Zophobas morio TaxID=2755281 RepID=UPI003083989A